MGPLAGPMVGAIPKNNIRIRTTTLIMWTILILVAIIFIIVLLIAAVVFLRANTPAPIGVAGTPQVIIPQGTTGIAQAPNPVNIMPPINIICSGSDCQRYGNNNNRDCNRY